MAAALTASPITPSTSLSATPTAGDGPFIALYPGSTLYPGNTTFPGVFDKSGVLLATVDLPTGGDYPGVFPGSTDFPGRGTNLVATPL